jgi:FAD synthase
VRVLHEPISGWSVDRPTAIAVGVFDGVHTGHAHILELVVERAASAALMPAVLTFDPHPMAVLAPERAPLRLTTIDQRVEQFGRIGIELVAVLPFTDEVRHMSPEAFVSEILVHRLEARVVASGVDFRFGERRAGDITLLEQMAGESGFAVVAAELLGDGIPISSTRIREALAAGDLSTASALLGRPYELAVSIDGTSVIVDPGLAVPGAGAYLVEVGAEVTGCWIDEDGVSLVSPGPSGVQRLRFRTGVDAVDPAELRTLVADGGTQTP